MCDLQKQGPACLVSAQLPLQRTKPGACAENSASPGRGFRAAPGGRTQPVPTPDRAERSGRRASGRGAGGTDLSGDGELQGQVEGGLVVRGRQAVGPARAWAAVRASGAPSGAFTYTEAPY